MTWDGLNYERQSITNYFRNAPNLKAEERSRALHLLEETRNNYTMKKIRTSWDKAVTQLSSSQFKENRSKIASDILTNILEEIGSALICPISRDQDKIIIIKDPVTLSNGITYDRETLGEYLKTHDNFPTSKETLTLQKLDSMPTNQSILKIITTFKTTNSLYPVQLATATYNSDQLIISPSFSNQSSSMTTAAAGQRLVSVVLVAPSQVNGSSGQSSSVGSSKLPDYPMEISHTNHLVENEVLNIFQQIIKDLTDMDRSRAKGKPLKNMHHFLDSITVLPSENNGAKEPPRIKKEALEELTEECHCTEDRIKAIKEHLEFSMYELINTLPDSVEGYECKKIFDVLYRNNVWGTDEISKISSKVFNIDIKHYKNSELATQYSDGSIFLEKVPRDRQPFVALNHVNDSHFKLCDEEGKTVKDVAGDGNCYYRSLAEGMRGNVPAHPIFALGEQSFWYVKYLIINYVISKIDQHKTNKISSDNKLSIDSRLTPEEGIESDLKAMKSSLDFYYGQDKWQSKAIIAN